MTLFYGKYTITGTVDEIREFIMKETPTSVSNTTTAIIKESDDDLLPTLKTIKCPRCDSKNVTLYNSGNASNGVSNKKKYFIKCNYCGKYSDIEVEI